MAFRKEKIKQQFTEAQAAALEPGEQVQAASLTTSGPSPWLAGAFGALIMLLAGMRYYYVIVTDRRVIFMKASMWTGRPKGVAWSDPRDQVQVRDVNVAKVWSRLRYRRPEGKEIRLNFHMFWKDEFKALATALGADVQTA
jgi:hypothetical protein